LVIVAERALDRAAKKGVLHQNNVSRRKSRLYKALDKVSAAALACGGAGPHPQDAPRRFGRDARIDLQDSRHMVRVFSRERPGCTWRGRIDGPPSHLFPVTTLLGVVTEFEKHATITFGFTRVANRAPMLDQIDVHRKKRLVGKQ